MWYREVKDEFGDIVVRQVHTPPTGADFANFWRTRADLGPYSISTVFLGVDHALGQGAPVCYETLVTCDGEDVTMERYRTRAEALKRHMALARMYNDVYRGNVAALGENFWEKKA